MKDAIRKALQGYPVFTMRDLTSLLNKKRDYAYLQAYRWKKKRLIHEIEKGKYTLEEDPFLVSSWVVWPSYISGWAALHYYHITEQLPFTIQVITTRRRKKRVLNYGKVKIEFTTVKPDFFLGFRRVIYDQREIFIAEKEKALIDALAVKRMSLGESIEMIKSNKGKINLRKLFSYAALVKGLTTKLKSGLYD